MENLDEIYNLYVEKLKAYGLYSEAMFSEIGDKIKNVPYNLLPRQGGNNVGDMIKTTLYILCVVGMSINKSIESTPITKPLAVADTKSLIRTLLILNLGKATMFERETEDWKIKKGELFRFSTDSNTIMTTGERTIYLCNKYGIQLTEEEVEAIYLNSKDTNTLYARPLANMVKAANDFTLRTLVANATK